ncbi:MAG TPA: imidazole glycerol phosphate synthase subunit HisH [Methanothrix sp.]|nr:imidazole glycerol phosphate synthase subunit HisH [Methanothrix sp.]OPX79483.1 MAG: imidazole glycerol phosphate synthase subunit HisH [Methanosaeta sp. PtaB.Bin087]OPY50079.1 MAG: imidazole glycerol phosphate synthase subunit HisH [Methanosaeta sp. PtaU1.Bin055]HNR57507.1 imidazole glycerol phosphate synthase subunit HisH [Methanothrix sp.]HNT72008.1 imidazole glycerol phosphate synthase subunit HisH [Methanothrix sp.]
MTIAVVDYGVGNLFSIYNALERIEARPELITEPEELTRFEGVVVPGVGSFGRCMRRLSRFEAALREALEGGTPILGICVGMQVLFERSEESPEEGLGWIDGEVVRLPDSVLVPQMGWNTLSIKREVEILDGISDDDFFYFVHSYHCVPRDGRVVAATTDYGLEMAAAMAVDNLFAVQFHPEKSGEKGLSILKNFGRLARC